MSFKNQCDLQTGAVPAACCPEFNEGKQYLLDNEKQLEDITTAIFREISSSVNKHGPMHEDLIHRAGIVCEESGELIRACINLVYEGAAPGEVYKEAIHTAATAIKFLLSLQKGRE
jgi:hypothetical protein